MTAPVPQIANTKLANLRDRSHVSQAGGSFEPFLNFLARGFAALVLTLVLIVGLSPMVCFAVIQMWG